MKKLVLSILLLAFLPGCSSDSDYAGSDPEAAAAPQSYAEWDSSAAARAGADVHNMFVPAPRRIERPIDAYMAQALALKYNYTRRLVAYEQAMAEAGRSSKAGIPQLLSRAGYVDGLDSQDQGKTPDLKAGWNLLDLSSAYYQGVDSAYKGAVAYERGRKVIHNILQEARALYWRALAAQRLLPVIDDMAEYMVLEVDELNAKAYRLAEEDKSLSADEVKLKRDYMEEVQKLSDLKRKMETAQTRLSVLMGFHPAAEYKLVGKQYGNFALPAMKNSLSQLEKLALENRPELKLHDLVLEPGDLKLKVRGFEDPGKNKYAANSDYYNKQWAKNAEDIGYSVLEDLKNPGQADLRQLRRHRMTSIVLGQVYVSWAMVMSATEDYQIAQEIADASEAIAEDAADTLGTKDRKAKFDAARAIEDEAKASLAYVGLQESLGALYAAVGLDSIPYYMPGEKPSKIAVYLRQNLERWRGGDYLPESRPYLLDIPSRRPPVNISSDSALPDIAVETGSRVSVTVPQDLVDRLRLEGRVISKAGLEGDAPLPKWLSYSDKTHTLSGTAMPSTIGTYPVKVYFADSKGTVGFVTFKVKVEDVFVPSMRVRGLSEGRKATVLKRCVGAQCKEDYIDEQTIGEEVELRSRGEL